MACENIRKYLISIETENHLYVFYVIIEYPGICDLYE